MAEGSTTPILNVHFNSTSSGNVIGGEHYWPLTGATAAIELNIKCKEIYISAPGAAQADWAFRVIADLTGIPSDRMYPLTGSGLTD